MSVQLTNEQEACICKSLEGHNFLITGKAGTGKSCVVCEMEASLRASGKMVKVICSTGMACDVYRRKFLAQNPSTVHSFLGIGTASAPFQSVVERATKSKDVVKRLKSTDCVIWDECSMGSARLLELLHEIVCFCRENRQPFGGCQVICVGDHLQLKPVPGRFDEGKEMYQSDIYKRLLPHAITLTQLHRQNTETQELFIAALEDLRYGICSDTTADMIKSLNRPTATPNPLHLYLTNIEADAHNAEQLHIMDGLRQEFVASDWGNVEKIQSPIGKRIYFKPGAPVIIVYNISEEIHNGTRATFIGKDGDDALVEIEGAKMKIRRATWTNYNQEGQIIGSRCQIPMKLFWASTVNKVQGQELEAVCFHSSYEFTGGLIYTALSRVKKSEDVEVRDFIPSHVKSRNTEIEKMSSLHSEPFESDCSCCTPIVAPESQGPHHLEESQTNEVTDVIEHVAGDSEELESMTRSFMDASSSSVSDGTGEELFDLDLLLDSYDDNNCFASDPPEDFDFKELLMSFKDTSRFAESAGFAQEKNALIDELIACESKMKKATTYITILWKTTSRKLQKFVKENVHDTRISRVQFTKITQDVWRSNASKENHMMLRSLFQLDVKDRLTAPMLSLGANLNYGVFQNIIHIISDVLRANKTDLEQVRRVNVADMDAAGRAKVRYIAGWMASCVMKKSRKYIDDNMYSQNSATRARVKKEVEKLKMLKTYVVVPYHVLLATTSHRATLDVIEARQYRTHGLIHVSDAYFEAVMQMEQMRVDCLNANEYEISGEDIVENATKKMLNSRELINSMENVFPASSAIEEKELVSEMFHEMVSRFIHMGTKQFLKDMRREREIKKTAAHRHNVLIRQKKKERKAAKVELKEIRADSSPGRATSHQKLVGVMGQFGESAFEMYTKSELHSLCDAYGVSFACSTKKQDLCKLLAHSIKNCHRMPFPINLSRNLRVVRLGEGEGVKIRIFSVEQ